MRHGFKVIDADTHFQPSAESILPYLVGTEMESRIPEFEQSKTPVRSGRAGQKLPEPYYHWLRFRSGGGGGGWAGNGPRILGTVGKSSEERQFQAFMGSRYPTVGVEDHDVETRVKEMTEEGADFDIMVPSAFTGHAEPEVDMAFIGALHRYLDDQCAKSGGRLKSIIQVSARDVEGSVAEMKKWADADWAVAVQPVLPVGMPVDHPDLEPIWKQADDQKLCIVHHSGGSGYPGERDLWDNPFLGRLSSHPWGAMRFVAAMLGAGIMDRYQNIHLAILESGYGWLPFWGRRMDDQVHYMGYVNPDLKKSMWEHLTSGRFFASIVIHEGAEMARMVNQLMGDGILMYSSDYPHAESRFPDSVDICAGWDIDEDAKKKFFWENAARCFRLDENGHRIGAGAARVQTA
jgi:predicted TIM-barrel fold metal-dependent hydrolase